MALFFNKNLVSLKLIKYIKNINKKLVIYKKFSKFLSQTLIIIKKNK